MEQIAIERLQQGAGWLQASLQELRRRWEREGFPQDSVQASIERLLAQEPVARDAAVAELLVWHRLLPLASDTAAGGRTGAGA